MPDIETAPRDVGAPTMQEDPKAPKAPKAAKARKAPRAPEVAEGGEGAAASGARLNVNINARTADELRRIARQSGISYTEAVRRAVEVLAFIVDEREAGHAIQVYDPEKDRTRELITL